MAQSDITMLRRTRLLAAVTFCLAALLNGIQPTAAAGSSAYLIGSSAPLTEVQLSQLRDAGAQVRHVYRNFGGAAAVIAGDRLAQVRGLPFVTSLSTDTTKELLGLPSAQPLPGTPYWLDQIDREKVSETGSGVWVAVVDSGFYPNWRDYLDPEKVLIDKAAAFVSASGQQNNNQWDRGSEPHGMAVSATIVGHRFVDDTNEGALGQGFATGSAGVYDVPGIAPGAKIIPIKVCEPTGCFQSAINAAVDYVTTLKKANPAQPIIINESLGGRVFDPLEKSAIDAAVAAGVVIVASAGNSGDRGMSFPAAYEPVISVGAGGWTHQWHSHPDKRWWLDDVPENGASEAYVTFFSSRPKAGQFLDVVSEGRYLLLPYPCAQILIDGSVTAATVHRTCAAKASPDNANASPFQYMFMSGTSFASPSVAGIVALMLERSPSLNNANAAFGTLDQPSSWGPGALEVALEGSAEPIAPGSVTVMDETGAPLNEMWGANATGAGWVFADKAVAAA